MPVKDEDKDHEDTETFISLNPDTKLLETRLIDTGELVAVQNGFLSPMQAKENKAIYVKINGKRVLVAPGTNPDLLRNIPRRAWVFSEVVSEGILQRIQNGETLSKICKSQGYPSYNMFCRWRRENKKFDEAVRAAMRNRAEFHRDEVLRIAQDNESSRTEDIGGAKLAIDSHKWLASTDHSERFGNKTHVDADVRVATKFIIDTGIRRPDDVGYNRDQTKIAHEVDVSDVVKLNPSEEKK